MRIDCLIMDKCALLIKTNNLASGSETRIYRKYIFFTQW